MIFLDANVFLRHLTIATSEPVAMQKAHAQRLMSQIEAGVAMATTSEVVLHEVCYILQSPKHYNLTVEDIAPVLTKMILWPGLTFPNQDRDIYLQALKLWRAHPILEFSDSVIAARCERGGYDLATFDRHFANVSNISIWQSGAAE